MSRRNTNQSASKTNTAAVSPCRGSWPPNADIHDSQDTGARPDVSAYLPHEPVGATTNIVDGAPTANAALPGSAGTFEPREGYDDKDDGFISNGNEYPVVPIGKFTGHLTLELLSTLREEVKFFESSVGPIGAIDIDASSSKTYKFALHFLRLLPISREEIPQGLEFASDHLRRILGREDISTMTRALVKHAIELLWRASETLCTETGANEDEYRKLVSAVHLALQQLPNNPAGQQKRIVQKLLAAREAVIAVPERGKSTIDYLAKVLPEVAGCVGPLSDDDIAAVLQAPDRESLLEPVNRVLQRFGLKRADETSRKLIDRCSVERNLNKIT